MAMKSSLRFRQLIVIALLFAGYASLYFCRADLSVGTPQIVDALRAQGVSREDAVTEIGRIVSLGVLAYALGKLFLTGLGDFWGGRVSFLIGLAGACVFTLWFAFGSSLPVFAIAWFGNRLTQSIAWAGLIKISSRWFDYTTYGTVIGILSISYLVGDAAARESMGLLIGHGFPWPMLFYYAAGVAGILFVANLALLRESRTESGFPEAKTNPLNLFSGSESRPKSVRALLVPLLRSRAFLIVCGLSLACTIIRETFNTWNPYYLRDHLGYSAAVAARLSALFPAVGAVSVLLSGWLSDRLGPSGRSMILCGGLAAAAAALLLLMSLPANAAQSALPLIAIGMIAFCLLGPYSYLGGAFALDFGGKQAAAASSGIIDGVGYLGAVVAGDGVAQLALAFGWHGVFLALAGISALAALGGGYLWYLSATAIRTGRTLA